VIEESHLYIWLTNSKINFNKTPENKTVFMHLSHLNKINKINLWHRRLGHYNINSLKNKLLKINIKLKCPICSGSKLRDFPYKKSKNKPRHCQDR